MLLLGRLRFVKLCVLQISELLFSHASISCIIVLQMFVFSALLILKRYVSSSLLIRISE